MLPFIMFLVVIGLQLCTAVEVTITDAELAALSEKLLSLDVNNVADKLTLNLQQRRNRNNPNYDAPAKLFTSVAPDALTGPTYRTFIALFNNYEPSTTQTEYVTSTERAEEDAFITALTSTKIIRELARFLGAKEKTPSDKAGFTRVFKDIWFSLYSRGSTRSSNGFEHVFLGEIKNNQISGFHNWVFFYNQEVQGRVNYLGFTKSFELGQRKGIVIKDNFTWNGKTKPVTSMLVGTSPELEMALYTVCFFTRPNAECKLRLNNKNIKIKTFGHQRAGHKTLVGSAFVNI